MFKANTNIVPLQCTYQQRDLTLWLFLQFLCRLESICFFFQVKKFLVYFRNMITEGMTYEISNLYENTFPKLTEQYFDNTPWPHEDEVSPLVDNDPVSITSPTAFTSTLLYIGCPLVCTYLPLSLWVMPSMGFLLMNYPQKHIKTVPCPYMSLYKKILHLCKFQIHSNYHNFGHKILKLFVMF